MRDSSDNQPIGTYSNKVLCDFFTTELTILSDGNVTTCCVDCRAANSFANIYTDSLKTVLRKHLQFKEEFIYTPQKHATCHRCLETPGHRYYLRPANNDDELAMFVGEEFLPSQIVLEVSSRCNVRCRECIHGELGYDLSSVRTGQGGRDLDLEYVADWLRPLGSQLKSIRAYNYGEPFLNKNLEGFAREMTTRIPDIQIGVSTNGTVFLNENRFDSILASGLYHIVVSVHGGNAEASRQYMGSAYPFERVVQGLKRFMVKKRQTGNSLPVVDLKCVLFRWNESEVELSSFEELAHDLQVDIFHFTPTGGVSGTKHYPPGSDAWNKFLKSGRAVQGDPYYISRIHPYAPVEQGGGSHCTK